MYGYVYLTTNTINGRMYIGKHKSETYDSAYYGSGKILLQAIKKYGLENFNNEILYEANNEKELNEWEKYFINLYLQQYGKRMYNIAFGGDGGDTYSHRTNEEKEEFIKRMTTINKNRCSSRDFKYKMSKRLREKYSNPDERDKQSEKIRVSWSDEKLKREQSERLKDYYKNHKKDNSYLNIPCVFELNGIVKEFENIKSLKHFLKEEYNYTPSNPKLKQLLINGTQGIPYTSFFKTKHNDINGMLIYYKQNENVETMGDECNPVGHEIGTCSKRKTEIEEIVRSA